MQRTEACLSAFLSSSDKPAERADSAVFSLAGGETPCAVFGPVHYEPGYAYPLLVWLHGPGSDQRQLVRIMPSVSLRNYVAAAPQGLCVDEHAGRPYDWPQTPDDVAAAQQRVFEAVDLAAERLHVAPHRVFLAGFASGGSMALRVGLLRPERFAGVVSLCGPVPAGRPWLGNLVAARRVPLLLAVGRRSTQYPAPSVCEHLRLLHSAGMSVTLRQYPCGDELSPQMLGDVDRWIIEQIASPQPAEAIA